MRERIVLIGIILLLFCIVMRNYYKLHSTKYQETPKATTKKNVMAEKRVSLNMIIGIERIQSMVAYSKSVCRHSVLKRFIYVNRFSSITILSIDNMLSFVFAIAYPSE